MDILDRRSTKRIFTDWKIYCGVLMYMGVVNTGYATSFFIPTIIEEMGYTATMSQVRSIPIFIVAAVTALAVAWCTDRVRHRYGFTIAGVVVGMIGYVILLCQNRVSVGVKYMACFFITTGGYMTQPVTWVWLSNVSPFPSLDCLRKLLTDVEYGGSLQALCSHCDANRTW